jgi:2-methylcitrate dehydratase PrpD
MPDDSQGSDITRRRMLQGAGTLFAAATLSLPAKTAAQDSRPAAADVTGRLARYMVAARGRPLPPAVVTAAKHRILDTVGAIVSGSHLPPGEKALEFVRSQGGTPEASIFTTDIKTTAINAALVHGMFGHADETDDFEPITKAHPGCAVVPAAFAMAERAGRSGAELIGAVALGYDLCCRFLQALGPDHVRATHRSAEGTSATFGAVGAAASLARLDETGMRYALSYAAQQVSGIWSWARDSEHVEKAFDFGGMGARNGVTAAVMAEMGFTGVAEVLDGEHNMIEALSTQPRPEQMVARLGELYYVTETALKVFSVGYPIQSPLDALLTLRRRHDLTPDNVEHILVRLPADGAAIVDNRAMPDVNLQYAIAVALIDGTMSFEDSHARDRMSDPRVVAVRNRVELVADRALVDPEAPRSGFVEVTLRDGAKVSHFTRHPPGTKENPLTTEQVNAKVLGLIEPVLGATRSRTLIERLDTLEAIADIRELLPLLTTRA